MELLDGSGDAAAAAVVDAGVDGSEELELEEDEVPPIVVVAWMEISASVFDDVEDDDVADCDDGDCDDGDDDGVAADASGKELRDFVEAAYDV